MRRVVIDTNLYIDWINAGRHESVVLQRDAIKSFFATVKVELVHDATWATRAAARAALFEYIERFYNGERRHSALGYLSPRAFERQREQRSAA